MPSDQQPQHPKTTQTHYENTSVKWHRRSNLLLSVVWLGAVPIAIFAGWLYSLAFISACSIYANFASHVAAWRSDVNPQLDRLEEKIDILLGKEE
jgi:hypothetical protein